MSAQGAAPEAGTSDSGLVKGRADHNAEAPPAPTGRKTLKLRGAAIESSPSRPAPAASAAPSPSTAAPGAACSPMRESRAVGWNRFFFVWSPTEERPKRRHGTLESARAEAARLRAKFPGRRFHVYRAELIVDELQGAA